MTAAAATPLPLEAAFPAITLSGAREDVIALHGRLLEVFRVLEGVPLDGTHTQGWKYSSAAAVAGAVRGPLRDQGILLFPAATGFREREYTSSRAGSSRVVTTVDLRFTFVDAATGASISCAWLGAGADDAEKGAGKAITVGLRTFLQTMFLLLHGDDDADSSGGGRGGGGGRGRGTNDRGENLASHQQLREIEAAASGGMKAVAFLNVLLEARGIEPVNPGEVSEADALKRYLEHLQALTTVQAGDVLRRVKELAGK